MINAPDDPFRNYLAGSLGAKLFELLASAAQEKREIYAALYELDDEQLEAALEKFWKRAHVVLFLLLLDQVSSYHWSRRNFINLHLYRFYMCRGDRKSK